jgi:predicted acyltransferase
VNAPSIESRISSVDFFRGLIMVLLMLEAAGLYHHVQELYPNPLVAQFFHHPWNGLYLWDLIQPAFMFIAGVGMALSLHRQKGQGITWNHLFTKVLKRSGWLFFWGVLNYAVRPEGLSFELWNVLTQLAFTMLVAFLIFYWPIAYQVLFCLFLLILTELLYRYAGIPGFDQPFVNFHNFGNYVDLVLMGKINSDGWVAFNCVPTAVHTIMGALVGKLLVDESKRETRVKFILFAGVICLLVGYGLLSTVTPIIKRISTSSFVIVSGGWCLLCMAILHQWIDVQRHNRHLQFFTIVGMNSIFIYLFFEIVGLRWFNDYTSAIMKRVLEPLAVSQSLIPIISSLVIFSLEWYLCLFLYRKKIFFKL